MKKKILCIVGPTAAGKSKLAMEFCRKNIKLNPEIISMDSAQIFKEIDIATAKPTTEEQNEIPHHLINICDPVETYSVAKFINDTNNLIIKIIKKNGTPIIVGGTMMYLKRLIEGIVDIPVIPNEIRNKIKSDAEINSWHHLFKKLSKIDPNLCKLISQNDSQRITRGLEVWEYTGKTLTDWKLEKPKSKFMNDNLFDIMPIALIPQNKKDLHEKIKIRFMKMIQNGLIDEVKNLKKRGDLTLKNPSIKLVGVKQTWHYLENNLDIDDLLRTGIVATRQLAKHQLTWINKFESIKKIDPYELTLDQQISICESSF